MTADDMTAETAPRSLTDFGALVPTTGTHLIEASAGTGKTYALATLTVRYLLETDISPGEILLVTFTNEAAGELRHRVRQRLTDLMIALRGGQDGLAQSADGDDYGKHLLASGNPDQLIVALEQALQSLDEASISTIHGFSQQLIAGAGLAGNPDLTLRSDLSDLETAVIANNLTEIAVTQAESGESSSLPGASTVVSGLRKGRNQPGIRIEPNSDEGQARLQALTRALALLEGIGGQPDDLESDEAKEIQSLWDRAGLEDLTLMSSRTSKDPTEKVRKAIAAMQKSLIASQIVGDSLSEITDHLDATSELGFNDLLVQAATLVESPEIRDQLQQRFRLVLVDEFQDTDPVQWKMLSAIATPSGTRAAPALIAVGDPKQAIYRFRGGNITTYQAATQTADTVDTLGTNWRSTASMVDALNHLFEGTTFGDGIVYQSVAASGRVVDDDHVPIAVRTVDPTLGVAEARGAIAHDMAQLIAQTVEGSATSETPIRYRDVAVLYRAHEHGPQILRALKKLNIPAVVTRGETVLGSNAVGWWRSLFWALERPSDTGRAKAVALTPFFNLTTADLLDDERIRDVQTRLLELALTLERFGVTHLVQRLLRTDRRSLHFASQPNGERSLVDVLHLGELLHTAAGGEPISPRAARQALDELVFTDPDDVDYANELTKMRLDTETDEDVVRVMSVHAAKGLEFEMVCCPTLWTSMSVRSPYNYIDGDTPVLNFSTKDYAPDAWQAARNEDLGESARLAYVAVTRPVRRLAIWWPAASEKDKVDDPKNGIDELMMQRAAQLGVPGTTPSALEALAAAAPNLVSLTPIGERDPAIAPEPNPRSKAPSVETLAHAKTGRVFDRTAERLSFSQISGVAFPYDHRHRHSPADPDQPEDSGSVDESPDEALDALPAVTGDDVALAELPAGKDAGTRLHSVFENVDFAAATVDRLTCIDQQVALQFPDLDVELHPRIVSGIDAVLATPLGSTVDGVALAEVTLSDRIDEMQFDLPLRTGPDHAATLPALGDLLRNHTSDLDPHADLVRKWALQLATPGEVRRLGGFLTGSIDLLFRRAVDGTSQYIVADYKSNRIAVWPEPLSDSVYAPDRLGAEMLHGHYLMQALLYLIATNRFLKLRLASYEPDTHLGPALYLFVRGMTGALTNAEPHGVFSWRPSTDLIEAADELLLEPMLLGTTQLEARPSP